jgi:hypothetical protein
MRNCCTLFCGVMDGDAKPVARIQISKFITNNFAADREVMQKKT